MGIRRRIAGGKEPNEARVRHLRGARLHGPRSRGRLRGRLGERDFEVLEGDAQEIDRIAARVEAALDGGGRAEVTRAS
jgi:hypothetical protein